MTRGRSLPPNLLLATIAAFLMFLVAIFVRNYWLSLIFGVLGAATFAYGAAVLRAYRRRMVEEGEGL